MVFTYIQRYCISAFFSAKVSQRFPPVCPSAMATFFEARTERRNWTELTRFSCWRTDQWASSNALQWAPSNGVVAFYVTARTYTSTSDQWARFVKNEIVSVQFISVTSLSIRAFNVMPIWLAPVTKCYLQLMGSSCVQPCKVVGNGWLAAWRSW